MGLGVGLGWVEAAGRMIPFQGLSVKHYPKLVSPDLFLVPVVVLWMMEAGCLGQGAQSGANSVMSIVWSFCPSWSLCAAHTTDAKKILELGVF